jgi:hypothetical protein
LLESRFVTRPIPTAVLVVALAVVALNLLDAFCTLRHIEQGAIELNPLMRLLLDEGPLAFVVGKHILAAGGVVGIVAHARHAAARKMLGYVLLPVYGAIGTYQLALFAVV